MIRAEQYTDEGKIAVEIDGDPEQNESELIGIMINALSAFSEEDLLQMLVVAVQYNDSAEPYDSLLN